MRRPSHRPSKVAMSWIPVSRRWQAKKTTSKEDMAQNTPGRPDESQHTAMDRPVWRQPAAHDTEGTIKCVLSLVCSVLGCQYQCCGLRPSLSRTRPVWDQKIGLGLGLAGLMLRCERRSCHARRHNDLEGHSNFSSTIYSFSFLCLEHHYCGDQQWRLFT